MNFVYILKGESGKYYIGSTTNLKERLKHHFGGNTPSTSKLGKLELVFKQKYDTLKDIRYIEKRLKSLKRKDYLDKIVREGVIKITPP
ncbi:MAG: GIY-YIG nuclease family protein [bacterium]|nr:GIY-YIG nuclease family protein [bacterium]